MKLPLAVVVLVLIAVSVLAEEPTHEAPSQKGVARVWEGYLYRDREKRVQIGWPVVAMGVMEQPDHVIAGDLARRIGPLVSSMKGSYVFWNYTLEEKDEKALAGVPRILVRIRGQVGEEDRGRRLFGGHRRLTEGRLLSVEFLSQEWLLAWAEIFRDKRSEFRIDLDRKPLTDRDRRAFAPRALAILERMRTAPGATAEEIALAGKIEPGTKVSSAFRLRTERGIQRWLTDTSRKLGLDLPGLAKLGPLPPSSTEIQRWFLASTSRMAFMKRVEKSWTGDLGEISLVHYEKSGKGSSYTVATLDEVNRWSDETFLKRLATTREILER